ncbi:uncharacterized protein Dana_GF27117, isoform B [Drosophila ananassae]|nr:uncharacterized protein LOC26514526 isoform X1 [Drosophila ananassae]XP_032309188.1 uncharacterized protein LOC26514526 isoform X1 [Drosophila ananassae]XP_032309189.1 uncharacterized protein LOC26514526 isoform X1 [Drosophila ananassae]KPU74619.1 uncharacterized protein Dana_GF27117, isoform B [Drosophila ananassae]
MNVSGAEREDSGRSTFVLADSRTPTEDDVLNIYQDVSKLADIERHLNMLYRRPFTCFSSTKAQYNLMELEVLLGNAKYDPDRHLALFVNRFHPVCSLKIYANGNIYCQAFSRESARRGLVNMVQLLQDTGYSPSLPHIKFNVVNATFCVPFHLDLRRLHQCHFAHSQYSPTKQPFVTYRLPDTLIKFAIFPSGYVYVMFASLPRYTKLAIGHILPILYLYKASPVDQGALGLCRGDINFQVLWEKEFQREDDFSIEW